jgi:hypothetical protein
MAKFKVFVLYIHQVCDKEKKIYILFGKVSLERTLIRKKGK